MTIKLSTCWKQSATVIRNTCVQERQGRKVSLSISIILTGRQATCASHQQCCVLISFLNLTLFTAFHLPRTALSCMLLPPAEATTLGIPIAEMKDA